MLGFRPAFCRCTSPPPAGPGVPVLVSYLAPGSMVPLRFGSLPVHAAHSLAQKIYRKIALYIRTYPRFGIHIPVRIVCAYICFFFIYLVFIYQVLYIKTAARKVRLVRHLRLLERLRERPPRKAICKARVGVSRRAQGWGE